MNSVKFSLLCRRLFCAEGRGEMRRVQEFRCETRKELGED